MKLGALFNFKTEATSLDLGIIEISIADIEYLIGKGIKIIVVLLLMYFTIKIGNRLINKFVDRQIKSNTKFSMDTQKALTIGEVLKSILKYMTYFIGAAILLSDFFKGVSVALASVGGFALGFGAQSLVKDIINGFFILFEDQYGVGDHVTIGTFTGIIETIGIRTTVIRDFTGDIHLIPNGSIVQVTNHSRGNIRFIVDIEIAYEDNIDNAIDIISNVCKNFEERNDEVTEPIEVLGVNSLNPSSVTIRVSGRSKPLKQWKMERELRKEIKLALDREGIEIPYPKTEFIQKEE
ncbi:mechanosensitive ion channel family protein [Clostridium paraputrificum]|uniref:mechanosensitive ion channel family protein n=1 Tax=Clostridium paraputrificum TaxID=29363 RepID=UPI003D351B40